MTKQQRLVLTVSILAAFVSFMDGAIVNVALPAIQRDLGGGLSAQQWIVDAYLLTLGSLILIAGSLSDLFGRKRILASGLVGFGIASVLCALAPTSTWLIVFRGLQGIAGALLVPSSLALIMSEFKGPAQGKAIGSWTGWTGMAFIIGPLVGGTLIGLSSWRWIFAINVVPIILTLYLLKRLTTTNQPARQVHVDYVGTVLCALGLGGPVYALIEQPGHGWSSPLIYLTLGLGLLLLVAFVLYERRAAHPMLPLSLFRNRNFTAGNLATLAIYAGLSVSTFLIVLFVQQVGGYSALASGLSLLPVTIIMFFLSARFGALAGRYGPRLFMTVGPLIAGLGFLLLLRVGAVVHFWTDLLPGVLIFGLGLSMTVAPLTSAVLGAIPPAEAGVASAVNNAVARITGLVAIAVVGSIVALQFGTSVEHNLAHRAIPTPVLVTIKQDSLQTTPPPPYQHDPIIRVALRDASVAAFHRGIEVMAGLLFAGGVISYGGIRNPTQSLKSAR